MADLQPRKCGDSVVEEEEDRISQLPSGILSHILSFLSMKDAARTSVLSKDWIRRWLFTDEFYFDVSELLGDEILWIYSPAVFGNMGKYAEWVSNVLRAHHEAMLETDGEDRASVIKKLRIRMPLCETYQDNVDEWISYAFTRKVETLELRLASQLERCCFPSKLIERDFDCLKSLSLVGVGVTGEDVEVFLRKFRFLEYLKLCLSDALLSVEVCGSSLALKHLEILDCPYIKYAIVRNTCLASLTITWLNKVVLENNPKLVDVRAGGWSRDSLSENILKQLSDCFPSLESLTLDADYFDEAEVMHEVPQLSELKQLTLIVNPCRVETLERLTALLSSSPKLEKLVLEFGEMHGWGRLRRGNLDETNSGRGPMFPLQHLKAVEVREYYGDAAENKILMYFFNHTLAPIETVTFDPNNLRRDMPTRPRRSTKIMSVEKRAALLRRVIPSSVEFILI